MRPSSSLTIVMVASALVAVAAGHDLAIILFKPIAAYLSFMTPDPLPHPRGQTPMLVELLTCLRAIVRLIAFLVMLWGTLLFLAAMLGAKGQDGYIKGTLWILIGGWIGRLAL